MIAEIIAVGSEMLTPYRQDTNSLAITAELNQLGVEVAFKTILGDNLQQLVDAVTIALRRADIVVLSGGLGPTEDDLTREAVAAALGRGLWRDETVVDALKERFAKRGIALREINYKQGDVIDGAELLPNANGTAPGQWIAVDDRDAPRYLALLPGPPKELTALFADQVRPRLASVVPRQHIAVAQLRMAVVPESEVDARTSPLYKAFSDVQTTILSTQGEIQLHFVCRKPTLAEAEARVADVLQQCATEMRDVVFSEDGASPEAVVLALLTAKGLTLATAESCTGGLLAQRLTSVPGSSEAFVGGAVVYSNQLKSAMADVPEALLQQYGAVSEPVARALADGIRQRTGAGVGVGITGIAGPGGGTAAKPVGLVYLAVSDRDGSQVLTLHIAGDRERVRWLASQHALMLVRQRLQGQRRVAG